MEALQTSPPRNNFLRNLHAGLHLATGRPLERDAFITTFDQGLKLLLFLIGMELLASFLNTPQPATFSSYGLNHLGAAYLFDLMLLLLIARLARANLYQTGGMLIASLSASPLCLFIAHLLYYYSSEAELGPVTAWAIWFLPITWQLYILYRLLRLFAGIRFPRAFSLALFNTTLSISSLWLLPQSQLWYTNSGDASSGPYAKLFELNVEDLFYDQQSLMNETIQSVAEQRPGTTDLYLTAVAGYGYERVFLNEVEYVKRLFDERFDTQSRSLVLVNNVETVDRYPLANRHNLRNALAAIGERMDPDEDLLFLFMTSHGSSDHRFSVDFGPVPLDDLTPQQVRQALDDAAIRWRVIVVSSCYSGGFIDPLKDPHTLIITAAAPDRESFGCGTTSEFTDFGTAYFKHALSQSSDFIQAFELASTWVAEKEQREGRKASLPQRFIGDAIQKKLSQLKWSNLPSTKVTTHTKAACHDSSPKGTCPP
jgi:hypothetical protein